MKVFAILLLAVAVHAFAGTYGDNNDGKGLLVRAKRQQCRCIRNPAGGLTCSCAKPSTSSGSTLEAAETQQSTDLANELTSSQTGQARCACIQIVFHGNPRYECQCGDANGNLTTKAPVTITTPSTTTSTTTTTTTTTTPEPTTTTTATTTAVPTTTYAGETPGYNPESTSGSSSSSPGVNTNMCQCIMIKISGPATAQYSCQCPGSGTTSVTSIEYSTTTPTPVETTSLPTPAPYYNPYESSTTTTAAVTSAPQYDSTSQYPLTTTCVLYVNVPTSSCQCLPQYDQCAQNVCCLKERFRKYTVPKQNDEPSTIDMIMNVLQKIKTKLE